ncbi:MAG TPA: di-heme oxidoredictase family protein [Steroidobacteraceae bacterium]|nr:di-heme oxidoredictase family protein [Steroidobacteraceae bacterium]
MALLCSALLVSALATAAATADGMPALGTMPYIDHRDQPPVLPLPKALADQYQLGHAVFNTNFLPVGTVGAGRRSGLGPLFNSGSCDECHNEGAHGRGPDFEGPLPNSMVVQLEALPAGVRTDPADPPGDPVYGRVLSPAAVDGFVPEGQVLIHFHVIQRTYPDGAVWTLRQPEYEITHLNYGPLAANVVVKPRLAPAIFGVGLLEAATPHPAESGPGRFGWQATALSVRDQTTRALAREMGVTSADRLQDDCTSAESQCLQQRHAEAPELSGELLTALLTFEQWVSVPANPKPQPPAQRAAGLKLFRSTGCAGCHQPEQHVVLAQPDGAPLEATIAPYSDLGIHDLGPGLADHEVSGALHPTRFRTAPLWGIGYRMSRESRPTFLHDGRARSVEEAVLWHDGEAAVVRARFEHLSAARRAELLHFVEGL